MTRKTKRTIWTVLAVIAVAVISVVIFYFTSIYNQLNQLQKTGEASPFHNIEKIDKVVTPDPPKWEGTERVNILLMGVDSRDAQDEGVPRSDSMLVLSLDPVQKKYHLFSLLRDTYTSIPDHGRNRINTAITHGPNTAMKAAGDLLGIDIQYYVYTDFQGFIKLVDAIGGVDFEVEKDMKYVSKADKHLYDIDLKQGMQHLDGNTALQYVRFRHDKMSDFSRTSRQRELLKAIAEKMQTTTSIAKLPSILEQVNPFIDTNLSVNDMWKLASVGYESKFGGSEQIPPMNMLKEERINGAAVLTVGREDKLKEYIQEFLNSTPEEETPEQDDTGTGTGTDSKSPPPTSPRESASEPSSGSSSSRASVSDIN